MDVDNTKRRSKSSRNGGVAAGSVWESRMRLDEVKGGIRVFSNNEDTPNENLDIYGNNKKQVDNKLEHVFSKNEETPGENLDKDCNFTYGNKLELVFSKNEGTPDENLEKDCNFTSGNNKIQVDKKLGPKPNLDEVKGGINVFSKNEENSDGNLDKDCNFNIGDSQKQVDKKLGTKPNLDGVKGGINVSSKNGSTHDENIEKDCKFTNGDSKKQVDEKLGPRPNLDEVEGGINVLSKNEENSDGNFDKDCVFTTGDNNKSQVDKGLSPKPSLGVGVSGKRRTWNSEGKTIHIAGKRSEQCKELVNDENGMRKVTIQNKKTKSKDVGSELRSVSVVDGIDKSSLQTSKTRYVLQKQKGSCESSVGADKVSQESERKSIGIKKTKSEENCEEFGVCEEKFITSNVVSEVKFDDDEEEKWDEALEEEIEKRNIDANDIRMQGQRPKKIVIEEKKLQYSNKAPLPISSIRKKQIPPTRTKSVSDEFQRIPRQHNRLQSLADLVMWTSVSKSALVFGIGTFLIISSSYTQDLNISFISVLSYLGLLYLAAIFLFRSLIHRGTFDTGESSEYVVGEEEAVWVLKLALPFFNEFLLKIRALFSGDPATTMKMALLLFVLAKCGSSITIWKLSKLGFFGVFVIPKICTSYSAQLTSYGTFFIQYIRDAWESCAHKKGVGFVIFTLVWSFSSIIARIWAVFMLYVGFRCYQQTLMREDTPIKVDHSLQRNISGQRQVGTKSSLLETRNPKKPFK